MDDKADFIAKLQQIEELARTLSAEVDTSRAQNRAQHIALLARALRGRLEFDGLNVARSDAAQTKPPP